MRNGFEEDVSIEITKSNIDLTGEWQRRAESNLRLHLYSSMWFFEYSMDIP